MNPIRTSFQVEGEAGRRTLLWSPVRGFEAASDWAEEVMRIVRPEVKYQIGDMEAVLNKNGITDLRVWRVTPSSPDV